jgi:hypothetical protein
MHVIPSPAPEPTTQVAPAFTIVAAPFEGPPANDTLRQLSRDVNLLIAKVVGDLTARLQPRHVNLCLLLATQRPLIHADPTELAFGLSGIIGSHLTAIDQAGQSALEVSVYVDSGQVVIRTGSANIPPISMVRALQAECADPRAQDPTVAHCRRLLEAQGAVVELTQYGDNMGFSIALPIVPVSRPAASPLRSTTSSRFRTAC